MTAEDGVTSPWGGDSAPLSDSMLVTARVADLAPSVARLPKKARRRRIFSLGMAILREKMPKKTSTSSREMIAVIEARATLQALSALVGVDLLPPQPDAGPAAAAILQQPSATRISAARTSSAMRLPFIPHLHAARPVQQRDLPPRSGGLR